MDFKVILYFLVGLALASATQMSKCTDSTGIYPNVTYSINSYVCEASPCTCTMGCESIINVNFQSPRYLETMVPKVVASSDGVSIVYPLDQTDVCTGFTNTQCPIVANEKVNYQYKLNIPAIFPDTITVTLRFSFIDEVLDEEVLCFEWDIITKKGTCPD